MKQLEFHLDDAVFTYVIAQEPDQRFSRHTAILDGALTISHTAKTEVITAKAGQQEIALIGYCIDSHGEIDRADIPQAFLSRHFTKMEEAYRFSDRFAGKFAVFFKNDGQQAMWTDACASVQVNYSCSGSPACAASTPKFAADVLCCETSEYSLHIRKNSTQFTQPLPNDLTMYDAVKSLLPNHYLDWNRRKPIRTALGTSEASSPDEIQGILKRTAKLARTIARTYQRDYSFVCPLTAGTDSRAVFAFLKENDPDMPCFTFRYSFTDQSAEIAVPRQICEFTRHPYTVEEIAAAPDEFTASVRQAAGAYADAGMISSAYTFLSCFSGKAQADGSTIDEIGKSTQENSVPIPLLNTAFFMCKLHNYDSRAKREMKQYIQDIAAAGETRHIADLFAMEQKMGQRVGPISATYAVCGISLLSIFNCRELILEWTRIPRKIRVAKRVPRAFLEMTDPKLLAFPFNPEDKLISLAKKHWPLFYLSTFLKHWYLRLRKTPLKRR